MDGATEPGVHVACSTHPAPRLCCPGRLISSPGEDTAPPGYPPALRDQHYSHDRWKQWHSHLMAGLSPSWPKCDPLPQSGRPWGRRGIISHGWAPPLSPGVGEGAGTMAPRPQRLRPGPSSPASWTQKPLAEVRGRDTSLLKCSHRTQRSPAGLPGWDPARPPSGARRRRASVFSSEAQLPLEAGRRWRPPLIPPGEKHTQRIRQQRSAPRRWGPFPEGPMCVGAAEQAAAREGPG